ncbi:MAG: hypothetical protein EXR02_03185 [Rhodospirillales bacterium]|nr:hypothetical protein [Rhodospirillales bacterium]MSP80055.1 hypothetical protein [Rhodospirillales bacterium]
MTEKRNLVYLPKSNENYYEMAWGARGAAYFARAEEEGKGSLYRTLKIFDRLDREHRFSIIIRKELDPKTQQPVETYSNEYKLTARAEAGPRSYPDIFKATKTAVEHRASRMTFAALNCQSLTQDWLCEIAGDGFDTIVELGSGFGHNLIEIYFRGGPANARYVGAEYTSTGRALMERFFKLEPKLPFATAFFDHRKPDLSFLKGVRKVLLFTNHSIEQVDRLPDDYFDVLAACAPEVVAVHFEPFGLQCPPQWTGSRKHREYIERNNYNRNMIETLRAAEKRRRLKVRWLAPDVIEPRDGNPTSIVLWDNQV